MSQPSIVVEEATRLNQNFQVCVRVRPLNSKEEAQTTKKFHSIVQAQDNMLFVYDPSESSIKDIVSNTQVGSIVQINSALGSNTCLPQKSPEKEFVFDSVFDERATTEQLFNHSILPSIDHILSGYNSTVFAYGMTGAGKTYTIFGNLQNSGQQDGIALMTLNALQSKAMSSTNQIEFKFSYLEIYNENIRDLMVETSENLMVVEDSSKGVFVPDLTEFPIDHPDDIRKYIIQGNTRRIMASTAANQFSSRSHAIIQILCEQKNHGQKLNIVSKLCIVDLAGSERGAVTENRGVRLQEGANINRSLLALGNCINLLSDKSKKGSFVPYRDSKLTRLLKESLGGNTRSIMIACISPSSLCYEETVNTLKYAVRARCIKKSVKKNTSEMAQHVSEYQNIIKGLRSEIVALNEQLQAKSNENQLLKIKQSILPFQGQNSFINQEENRGVQNVEEVGQRLFENLEEHWEISTTIEEIINLNKISENYIIEKEAILAQKDIECLSDNEVEECKDEIIKRREVIQSNQDILAEMNIKLEKNIEQKKELHMKIKSIGCSGQVQSNLSQISLTRIDDSIGGGGVIDQKNMINISIKDIQIIEMQKKMQLLEEELKNKDKLLQQKQTIIHSLTGKEPNNQSQYNSLAIGTTTTAGTVDNLSTFAITTNHANSASSCSSLMTASNAFTKKGCLQSTFNSNTSSSQPSSQGMISANYYPASQQTNPNKFYLKMPKDIISERGSNNPNTQTHASQGSSVISWNHIGNNEGEKIHGRRNNLKRQSSIGSRINNCSQNEDIHISSKKSKDYANNSNNNKPNFSLHQPSNAEKLNSLSKLNNINFNLSSRQPLSQQSNMSEKRERMPSSYSSSKAAGYQKLGQSQKKISNNNGINGTRLFDQPNSNSSIKSAKTMEISISELKSYAQKMKDVDFTSVGKQQQEKQNGISLQKLEEDIVKEVEEQKQDDQVKNESNQMISNQQYHSCYVDQIENYQIVFPQKNQGGEIIESNVNAADEKLEEINEYELKNNEQQGVDNKQQIGIQQEKQIQQPQQSVDEMLRGKSVRVCNQDYEINSYALARKRVRELKERLSRLCDNPSNANQQTPQASQINSGADDYCMNLHDVQSLNQLHSLLHNSKINNNNNNYSKNISNILGSSKVNNQKQQNNENNQPALHESHRQQLNNTTNNSNCNSNKKPNGFSTHSSNGNTWSNNNNNNNIKNNNNNNNNNTNTIASYAQQQQLRMLKRGGTLGESNSHNTPNNPNNCLKNISNNLNFIVGSNSSTMSTKNSNNTSNTKTVLPRGLLSQMNQNYSETVSYAKKGLVSAGATCQLSTSNSNSLKNCIQSHPQTSQINNRSNSPKDNENHNVIKD